MICDQTAENLLFCWRSQSWNKNSLPLLLPKQLSLKQQEGQVIPLAAPFLWFCAQRRHVKGESCEGRCYYPAERLCCSLEGMRENACGRGQSCLSLHCYYWFEMLLLWGLFICAPHCPCVVLWWLIQSRWKRLSVTENCSSKCLWGLSPSSSWQLPFRITSIM